MINTNDNVKMNGVVTATGTGTFTVSVNEFYVDGAWHKLSEPHEFEISTEGYNNDFTSLELEYIKEVAERDSQSTTICEDEMEIVNSIVKKLNSNASVD